MRGALCTGVVDYVFFALMIRPMHLSVRRCTCASSPFAISSFGVSPRSEHLVDLTISGMSPIETCGSTVGCDAAKLPAVRWQLHAAMVPIVLRTPGVTVPVSPAPLALHVAHGTDPPLGTAYMKVFRCGLSAQAKRKRRGRGPEPWS